MITILKDFGKYHQIVFSSFRKPFENALISNISRRYDISNHDKCFWWSLRARVGSFPCSNANMWVRNRNKDKMITILGRFTKPVMNSHCVGSWFWSSHDLTTTTNEFVEICGKCLCPQKKDKLGMVSQLSWSIKFTS